MLKKVTEAILRFSLTQNVKHITVALSGGADSMALLVLLLCLKESMGLEKISAAHFNHQIRVDEAFRDQEFVKKKCNELGVELFLGSADVPSFAKEHRLSLELAARKLRYEFFDTIDTDAIATAHTASDNVETVLFNLTRGTALSGLCGIPPKRDRYIRPLILCTRADIENYCEQNNIDFVTDSTNLCDEYTRNKIRHNVVPVLKTFNPSVETAVLRMTTSLCEDEDFIEGIAAKQYEALHKGDTLSLYGFCDLHPTIAKRIIARFYTDSGLDIDNFHINEIYDICMHGGKTSVAQNKTAIAQDGVLKIVLNTQQIKTVFKVDIKEQENDLFKNCEKVHNLLLKNILDCDKIMGNLVLRVRNAGDTVRLKNKNCTKTLKKLFCEYKIPLSKRENWPVLCDDEGIVWVHKIGVAERCAANENSERIYKINVEEYIEGKE